jgi:hypothetical protein
LAPGISPLTLANAFLTDNGLPLSAANGDFLLQNGEVTVTGAASVPEPGTLPVLSLALAVAFCIYRGRTTMRHSILAGVMLAALAFWTGAAKAQITESGPYYSLPSWDQTLPASTRFIVLSNFASAAVLDRETGLVWERTPSGTGGFDWGAAVDQCADASTGGRYGWRLPSAPELESLIDPTQHGLPVGSPFILTGDGQYWSATTLAEGPTSAFFVGFDGGVVGNPGENVEAFPKTASSFDTAPLSYWCVRGGSAVQSPQ